MHTGRCGNTRGQKCRAKGSRKEVKYKNLCIDIHEMYDYTGHNWSRRISNKRFKETFGSHTRKTFNIFTKQDRCTWNFTHNMGNTAV